MLSLEGDPPGLPEPSAFDWSWPALSKTRGSRRASSEGVTSEGGESGLLIKDGVYPGSVSSGQKVPGDDSSSVSIG